MSSRNEILLFTNGPGGVTSTLATKFFELKQKEALQALKERISNNSTSETSNLEILVDAVDSIDD